MRQHWTGFRTLATGSWPQPIRQRDDGHSPGTIAKFNLFATQLKEIPMIKKVSGGYRVLSSKGKNLGGPYKTRAEALKRLRQVEYFKRQK